MKKFKTNDERIAFIAKTLLKEWNASDKTDRIYITNCFCTVCSNEFNGPHVIFRHDYKDEVDFGELSDEGFGNITCSIADAICAKLKLKKSEIIHRDVKESSDWHGSWYGGYSSRYSTCHSIGVIRPCKGFFAINKKLKALGLTEIDFRKWYDCSVFGKRSHIFDRVFHYYAENEKKCARVLDYLKGKKKVSYEFVDEEDKSEREYGERYETEWSGSESSELCFTDSKGHKTVIY